jgi:hypothetical protein
MALIDLLFIAFVVLFFAECLIPAASGTSEHDPSPQGQRSRDVRSDFSKRIIANQCR